MTMTRLMVVANFSYCPFSSSVFICRSCFCIRVSIPACRFSAWLLLLNVVKGGILRYAIRGIVSG